jgi:TrpR-related protein YerC/YecD
MAKKFERLSREEKVELMFDLMNAFTIVKTPKESAYFLQDLLTANEIKKLAKRLRIAKLLLNNLTQRDVAVEVDVSTSTVNKVALWLDKGGDGFKTVIEKLPRKWEIHQKLPRGPIEYHLPQALFAITQLAVTRSQDGKVQEFMKHVKSKEKLDRAIRKETNEYYRQKRPDK